MNSLSSSHVRFSDDGSVTFLLRWRGRQEGPYTAATLEAKLAANEIGLLHEISHDGQWVTIRDYLAVRERIIRAERQGREEQERRAREEAERQTREREEQRRADALAEEKRKVAQVETDSARQQQAGPINSQPILYSTGPSGLRIVGTLLLLGGLSVAAYFFLAFDTSVGSGLGRVNNLGLMADRQNGIIIGVGLSIVGTIMLVVGARGRT